MFGDVDRKKLFKNAIVMSGLVAGYYILMIINYLQTYINIDDDSYMKECIDLVREDGIQLLSWIIIILACILYKKACGKWLVFSVVLFQIITQCIVLIGAILYGFTGVLGNSYNLSLIIYSIMKIIVLIYFISIIIGGVKNISKIKCIVYTLVICLASTLIYNHIMQLVYINKNYSIIYDSIYITVGGIFIAVLVAVFGKLAIYNAILLTSSNKEENIMCNDNNQND